MIEISKLDDLFAGNLENERDVIAAEPELGLGRCTPLTMGAAMPIPHCSSTARS